MCSNITLMALDPSLVAVAREVLRRRIESAVGVAGLRWSAVTALSSEQIVLLLADPELLHGFAVMSMSWEQPPELCFDTVVAAMGVDLGVGVGRATSVEALLAGPEAVSLLDAALDAVLADAPVEWAVAHAKASGGGS